MRGIEEMAAGIVKKYSHISEDKAKLFAPQREAIGVCPRCGESVYEGKKNYYCGNRSCNFVMWKNDKFFEQKKKAFTKQIAAALLKDGRAKVKGMHSTKTGKTFDGVVLLAVPLLPGSRLTRRQKTVCRDYAGRQFKALRGMQKHLCGREQPRQILPRLCGEDTPQTKSREREKQAFKAENNLIAT